MPTKLDSINLSSKAPMSLKDFYVNTFGFQDLDHISHPPGFFMLDANGCRLIIQDEKAVTQPIGPGSIELGIEADDLEAILESAQRNGGMLVQHKQQMGWGKAFTLKDPEGHIINVYTFNDR